MRFAGVVGLVALAGSFVPALPGQQAVPAAPAHCTGPFAQVTTPSPGSTANILYAVAAAGRSHVWAVGGQGSGSAGQNLILVNGGKGWSQAASPNPGASGDELSAVSASGPSDAWAAGWYDTGKASAPFAPQALHWDGSSWTAKPLPALPGGINPGPPGPGIVDISPSDAWLAGSDGAGSFIAHWNGSRWSLVTHPAVPDLTSLAASGPGDVWAVGHGASPSFPAVIEHYNGSAWTTSATLPGIGLDGIASVSAAQAWAVGSTPGGATATAEWNGSAWNLVPSPNPGSVDGLGAVSAAPGGGGGVWVTGTEIDHGGTGVGEPQPMAMHWDGTAWTAVPAIGTAPPELIGPGGTFYAVVALSGTDVVAVGTVNRHTLVADLCSFTVRDTGFAPRAAGVSGPGAAAYWVFPASDTAGHELADGTGFGLFDSGAEAPGSSYAFTFPASGTYTVTDKADGARERVAVPIVAIADYADGSGPALDWAEEAPPAGARFEVQDIPPGGTKFVYFTSTTRTGVQLSKKLPAGTYKFRSRMRNPATGVTTGWSPTATVVQP